MRRSIRITVPVILSTLGALSGCTQGYNGALGISTQDRQTVEAYEAFKQEQAQRLKAAATAERRTGPVDFQADGAGHTDAVADPQTAMARLVSNPDGTGFHSMALYGNLGQTRQARVSPLDGPDNLSRVTFTVEGADFDPEVDPTGNLLAYASTRHRETADIYVKRIDGSAITQLTSDPANDVMPAFSPDGSRIAFASDRSGNWDIYIMDASGGQAIQLTSDPTHDVHPSFSPDGRQIVYSSYGSSSGQWELVVIDLANPATKRIIGNGLFPNWSPVDNRIVYQRARQRGTRWFSVWMLELRDGEASAPTELAASSNAAVITPDWSPDGRHIVFCTVIEPGADDTSVPKQGDVWVMDDRGGNRSRLTSGHFASLQPIWSDRGVIYFVSNRGVDGTENVWGLRADQALRVAAQNGAPAAESATREASVPTGP